MKKLMKQFLIVVVGTFVAAGLTFAASPPLVLNQQVGTIADVHTSAQFAPLEQRISSTTLRWDRTYQETGSPGGKSNASILSTKVGTTESYHQGVQVFLASVFSVKASPPGLTVSANSSVLPNEQPLQRKTENPGKTNAPNQDDLGIVYNVAPAMTIAETIHFLNCPVA